MEKREGVRAVAERGNNRQPVQRRGFRLLSHSPTCWWLVGCWLGGCWLGDHGWMVTWLLVRLYARGKCMVHWVWFTVYFINISSGSQHTKQVIHTYSNGTNLHFPREKAEAKQTNMTINLAAVGRRFFSGLGKIWLRGERLCDGINKVTHKTGARHETNIGIIRGDLIVVGW